MSDRQTPGRQEFLRAAGWGDAEIVPLPGDASTRRYARLRHQDRRAMLMDQPQAAETAVAPPDADEAARRALGYNAVARLAGADCRRFSAVSDFLRARGLAAPEILAADYPRGWLVLEDLGDALFSDVLAEGGSEEELYKAAVEILARLHREKAPDFLPPPAVAGPSASYGVRSAGLPTSPHRQRADARAGEADLTALPLFAYDEIALIAETDLMLEWFFPLALGRKPSDVEYREHRALWRNALGAVASNERVFVHRDYHAQNLLWLPERQGLRRVGLIDFQDAVAGSRAYDLISLTEDARRDVPPELGEIAIRHYLATMRDQGTPLDEAQFRAEMAVMAAQRNTKIVGIFARLYARDGKRRYLSYLPRVWRYLERDLNHPLLADLKAWYDRLIPAARRTLPELESA
jgi:aminoglycoside/choline kinase family phosphotransferase